MELLEAMALRRSVREYRPDPVPQEILVKLIEAAHRAPSSRNLQPWEYIIVTDPELKKQLRPVANDQAQVEQAGAVIVVLGSYKQQDAQADRVEKSIPADAPPERRATILRLVEKMRHDPEWRRTHIVNSTYIGISFLVLAAMEYGLGTCWMSSFQPDRCAELLGIPESHIPVALVSVGYPAAEPKADTHVRRPVGEIIRWNRF